MSRLAFSTLVVAANVMVWGLGVSPGAGILATAMVALFGSTLVIVGQRKIWPADAQR
jgi:hypothetical protein